MKIIKSIYLVIVFLGVLIMCICITPIYILASILGCLLHIYEAIIYNPKSLN